MSNTSPEELDFITISIFIDSIIAIVEPYDTDEPLVGSCMILPETGDFIDIVDRKRISSYLFGVDGILWALLVRRRSIIFSLVGKLRREKKKRAVER